MTALPPSDLISRAEVTRMLSETEQKLLAAMDQIRAECAGILYGENAYRRAHHIVAIANSVAKRKETS